MNDQDRQFYIDWLLVAYPFKAESYFKQMDDRTLVQEYERLNEYM